MRYCEVAESYGGATGKSIITMVYTDHPTHSMGEGEDHCGKVAHFKNPFYGTDESRFNYAEWLCAEHYDRAHESGQPQEDFHLLDEHHEADSQY
jgi:hypothetical protein